MKKYLIIMTAMLLVTLTTTAQRKLSTDKLQINKLPNAKLLGTDEKGNLVDASSVIDSISNTGGGIENICEPAKYKTNKLLTDVVGMGRHGETKSTLEHEGKTYIVFSYEIPIEVPDSARLYLISKVAIQLPISYNVSENIFELSDLMPSGQYDVTDVYYIMTESNKPQKDFQFGFPIPATVENFSIDNYDVYWGVQEEKYMSLCDKISRNEFTLMQNEIDSNINDFRNEVDSNINDLRNSNSADLISIANNQHGTFRMTKTGIEPTTTNNIQTTSFFENEVSPLIFANNYLEEFDFHSSRQSYIYNTKYGTISKNRQGLLNTGILITPIDVSKIISTINSRIRSDVPVVDSLLDKMHQPNYWVYPATIPQSGSYWRGDVIDFWYKESEDGNIDSFLFNVSDEGWYYSEQSTPVKDVRLLNTDRKIGIFNQYYKLNQNRVVGMTRESLFDFSKINSDNYSDPPALYTLTEGYLDTFNLDEDRIIATSYTNTKVRKYTYVKESSNTVQNIETTYTPVYSRFDCFKGILVILTTISDTDESKCYLEYFTYDNSTDSYVKGEVVELKKDGQNFCAKQVFIVEDEVSNKRIIIAGNDTQYSDYINVVVEYHHYASKLTYAYNTNPLPIEDKRMLFKINNNLVWITETTTSPIYSINGVGGKNSGVDIKPLIKQTIKEYGLKINATSLPSSPEKGAIYFDETDSKLKFWDGAAWHNLY